MNIVAEMGCIVCELCRKDGESVDAGAEIMITESMKMQFPIQTPIAGTITYKVRVEDYVQEGDTLAEVV